LGVSTRAGDEIFDGEYDPNAHWSTTNLAEAQPGVQTPLSWSVWGFIQERGLRRGFFTIGALERDRVTAAPPAYDRLQGVFHGRVAARVEFLGEMGDRLPGTSGAAIAEQFLGRLPEGFQSKSTLRRLPVIAVRLPVAMARSPRHVRRVRAETAERWRQQRDRVDSLSLTEARRSWTDAVEWFERAYTAHVIANLAIVQPAYDGLIRLSAAAGRPELAGKLLAGQGSHPELAMVNDLWALSRDQIDLEDFLSLHGYHGPLEGELASRVWREDPRPVHELLDQYRARSDDDDPESHRRALAAETQAAKEELLAGLQRARRAPARLVIGMADRYMGLRGLGKAAFVQAFDVCRMLARRIGVLLSEAGALSDPEDIFYLTSQELLSAVPETSLEEVVAERRTRRRELEELELPGSWQGRPDVTTASQVPERSAGARLEGIGTSPGVVEAPVRVVTDPTFAEVEPGEILVAPVTDPAWAPIMFVSSALVVDIGGPLSHASVVARELGIPCVMGTGKGTEWLRSGDVCQVDGHAGTVEIVRLADEVTDAATPTETST
jgi:phosphohistidine swiveling domain-containing protein